MGSNSFLYKAASIGCSMFLGFSREGLVGVRVVLMRWRKGGAEWVRLRTLSHPIHLRFGTEDVGAVINNVLREEYGQFSNAFPAEHIIDAGAYIGDTSAYFLSRFKRACVVALEPNGESFALAAKNLEPYGHRVKLLKAALWVADGRVSISGSQMGCSIAGQGVAVSAVSMETLMREQGMSVVDVLKMDIEGAEDSVIMSGVGGWLSRVRLLLLETHGGEIEKRLIPMLDKCGFDVRRHRNVWYCFNREMVARA